MNEQIRNILVQETTKTSKIRQLYLLGVPRAEIARMVTNGNYGFVVNALRRMREREGGPNVQPWAAAPDYTFNRKFGIEIEAYNCSRERLARELREADRGYGGKLQPYHPSALETRDGQQYKRKRHLRAGQSDPCRRSRVAGAGEGLLGARPV